jgi:hypothetical protein
LPLAGTLALIERRHDTKTAVQGRTKIDVWQVIQKRLARAIAGHRPTARLGQTIEGDTLGIGAVGAVAGNGQ